jgi:hypothetical protein
MSKTDLVGLVMAYEAGQVTHEEVVAFYQYSSTTDSFQKCKTSTAALLGY